jgi:hypothetical protein
MIWKEEVFIAEVLQQARNSVNVNISDLLGF